MKLLPTRGLLARAAAHRAMAKAALFSDSSAAVRLKRYNSHMAKARDFEARQDEIRHRRMAQAFDLLRAEKVEGDQ